MSEPREPQSTEELQTLFEDSFAEIERLVSWIAARAGFNADDAEEFRSWAHLRLIERDYRVLRGHAGRSSLSTYLAAVLMNLARDYRIRRLGRWRASASARRLGVTAMRLEAMLHRDGFGLPEATEMLRKHYGVRLSAVEIAELAEQLPVREPFSVSAGVDVEAVAGGERADHRLRIVRGRVTAEEARRTLERALRELDPEDRLVLRLHYKSGLTFAAIARALDLPQRSLYTRHERSLRTLRSSLAADGFELAEILAALEWTNGERSLDFQVERQEGDDPGPSNKDEGPQRREND